MMARSKRLKRQQEPDIWPADGRDPPARQYRDQRAPARHEAEHPGHPADYWHTGAPLAHSRPAPAPPQLPDTAHTVRSGWKPSGRSYTELEHSAKPKQPERRKRLAILLVMVAISVPAVLAIRQLQAPGEGTVIKNDETLGSFDPSAGSRPATLNGEHFSLSYDSGFSDVTDISRNDTNALEQYRLRRPGQGGTSLVLSIRKLPPGGLAEDASYRLRKIKPNDYVESSVTVGNATATLMRATAGGEVVAFLPHGNLLATLAVAGSGGSEDLTKLAVSTLDKLVWRN
jgi:hypothetical protein